LIVSQRQKACIAAGLCFYWWVVRDLNPGPKDYERL
jgi:hypothetical protein